MNYFVNHLRAEQLEEDNWQLLEDLGYVQEEPFTASVVVPRGFNTDFASVPRLPLAYLLAGGVGNAAAVVHDYLYREVPHAFTRDQADEMFYQALLACSVPRWRAWLMWAAVRIAGSGSYREE